ncbi:chemotaxis protein CheC [Psychrobium sp. 1_MG-2023]|uniref:chemotaxis protein CheC n=1 Tax=Psychrobium sp. 1_MG-2023 TaxID=3062624 RepID=UPI000C34DC48|nr:chemotaxis protein CheC [Psychrobium sp. 1_MG-2023]MDP2560158.1 chemotaxis protein CheC [Psychrobium sp. 1_MG-2023]PKF56970.1 hypothetical protein CW748_07695 [Alteromonadales bacterium alter-6D02]
MNQALLSDEHNDTLCELFNIGMGRAANSLSEMVHEEVILSVPQLNTVKASPTSLALSLGQSRYLHAIEQCFSGDLSGQAYLVFDDFSGVDLVRQLLGESAMCQDLGELEQETLTEVANIILNACFCCIAEVLECDIESDVPLLLKGTPNELFHLQFSNAGLAPYLLTVSMTFQLPSKSIKGQVSILMATESLQKLIKELERFSLIYT